MITATIVSGYGDLAEWLVFIAAVLFVVAGGLLLSNRPDPTRGSLVAFGLACLAVAWLVL